MKRMITIPGLKSFQLETVPTAISYDFLTSKWLPVTLCLKEPLTNEDLDILKLTNEFHLFVNGEIKLLKIKSFDGFGNGNQVTYQLKNAELLDNLFPANL